eukprot:CAMPEP_0177588322 /NCGR_PEP_ID=MMETSP0419_2-20121207/6162_1 /TAXON_ID=582737 /ORGANISM="Tetraselmis sp., Strain GSL018" /LENGTH=309 /DNA_ID=CAMNT_0019078509 /DNA_START=491 /DNA_END=1421 /DNA_ORIENTATION=+
MVKNHAVEVLQAVLSRGASPRAEETACGIAANLLCHARLAGALEPGIPSLLSGVASVLEDSVSTAALTEACRAMAAAAQAAISGRFPGQWQHRLVGEGLLSRLVWMVDNSLDAALVANALELAGCAACMSELAVQRLLQHGLAAAAAAHLSGFCRAMVSDDGAAEPSASEAVADASLRVIEVIAAHDDGARAIEELPSLDMELVALLSGADSMALRANAVIVMAGRPFEKLKRVLLETPSAVGALLSILETVEQDASDARKASADVINRLIHQAVQCGADGESAVVAVSQKMESFASLEFYQKGAEIPS